MKRVIRGASCIALLAGIGSAAFAQQSEIVTTSIVGPQEAAAAQTTDQTDTSAAPAVEEDRVVITGSLIATAAEDAPRPVTVYTAEDLESQGAPSVSEFVRSLTISAGSDLGFGQASSDIPTGGGFANANLRGQGANGTLVLMNGRRVASTNGGFGADLNTLPMEAMEAVEILKDGASATYGAGAVGGVINFRTRRDINAPQISIERNTYQGGEGSYKLDFLTGWAGQDSNFLLSISSFHEGAMLKTKRGFSSQPYSVNPDAWSTFANNPGRWQGGLGFYTRATPSSNFAVTGAVNDYSSPDDCRAIGAEIASSLQPGAEISAGIPNTLCALPRQYFEELVNENDTNRLYAEYNGAISDNMEVHFDVTYSKSETIARRIPIDPALGQGATSASIGTAFCGALSCGYAVPYSVRVVDENGAYSGSTVRNPFIDDFLARTGGPTSLLGPAFQPDVLYNSQTWRPFAMGGNPATSDGLRHERYQRERLLLTGGVNGEFAGDGFMGRMLNGITYDYSAQYNQYLQTNTRPDLIVARLQNALLGYGGENCAAIDRVATDYTNAATFNRTVGTQSEIAPGTNGCQWFNPFASAYETSVTGGTNPQYGGAGYENSADLINWMTHPRNAENKYESATFDAAWTGALPESISLPGGDIGWALGAQWRMTERRDQPLSDDEAEEDLAQQLCPYPDPLALSSNIEPIQAPGMLGCTINTSPGAFFSTLSGDIAIEYSDSQVLAYFGQLDLPVTDDLFVSLSARRESFNGGDIIGDIWSAAGKYNITDNMYFRASYSTNFRAEEALDFDPGFQTFGSTTPGRFGGGLTFLTSTTTALDLGPEDDTTLNVGFGYEGDFGEGRFSAKIDYFEIVRHDEIATTNTTITLNNVFGINDDLANPDSADQVADCNARLINFLIFQGGCVQGTTTAADLVAVQNFRLNGPGFTTNGIDYSLSYSHPVFDGYGRIQFEATQNLAYESGDFTVNGVLFEKGGDRLGFSNVNQSGSLTNEWRANATASWSNERHNVSLRANFLSGITDDRSILGGFTAIDLTGAAPVYSPYGVNPEDYVDFDLTYIYSVPAWEELDLRLTVLNIADEDPMAYQSPEGYYGGLSNPRGRQIEFAATKKF